MTPFFLVRGAFTNDFELMTDNGVLSLPTEIDIPHWAPDNSVSETTSLIDKLPGLVAEEVLSLAEEIPNLVAERRPSLAEEV